MNCRKAERRISDSLDGDLSETAAPDLAAHLAGCPSCRAYRERAVRINGETAKAASPATSVPDGYWDDFLARVRARIESGASAPRRSSLPWKGWKWAWLAAPAVAAGLLIFFLVYRPGQFTVSDLFTYEEQLEAVSQAVSGNAELAGGLNAVILSSIEEQTGVLSPDEVPPLADDPGFWDSLTAEEAALMEREVAGELKS